MIKPATEDNTEPTLLWPTLTIYFPVIEFISVRLSSIWTSGILEVFAINILVVFLGFLIPDTSNWP